MGTAELSCASLEALARDRQFQSPPSSRNRTNRKAANSNCSRRRSKFSRKNWICPCSSPRRARDEAFISRTARTGAGPDRRRRLRTDSAAGHSGFAAPRLPERPHVAAAEISRRGADSMGDCQRRSRNRRDHHENGRGPGHRPDRRATTHADFAGRTIPQRSTTGSRGSARNCFWRNHSRLRRRKNPAATAARRRRRVTRRKSKRKTAGLTGTCRRKRLEPAARVHAVAGRVHGLESKL